MSMSEEEKCTIKEALKKKIHPQWVADLVTHEDNNPERVAVLIISDLYQFCKAIGEAASKVGTNNLATPLMNHDDLSQYLTRGYFIDKYDGFEEEDVKEAFEILLKAGYVERFRNALNPKLEPIYVPKDTIPVL